MVYHVHVCRITIIKLAIKKAILIKDAQDGLRHQRNYVQLNDVNISYDVVLYIFNTK